MFSIAILLSDGFDEWAVKGSKPFFKTNQYDVALVSPKDGEFVRSWSYKDWGPSYAIDQHLAEVDPASYDALLMPGGALSVDNLRTNAAALHFIRHFVDTNKPIGTLCHGIWPLIELGVVAGRALTAVPSIKTDIQNAKAIWLDQPVVQDGAWITSRTSEDLDEFLAVFQSALTATLQDTTE